MSDASADAVADLAARLEIARDATPRTSSAPAPPARECIHRLLDPGSFVEVGTLATSDRLADAATTPGDGKIGGHGRINGRPVTVVADDARIKRASTATVAAAKVHRLYEQAERAGNPFVYLGQTGGARIPDTLGARGHSRMDPMTYMSRRNRAIPLVSAIIGESFGGSSLVSALSDLTVQLRGSCLAVTSPLVIAEATGEEPTFDELGGVDVHAKRTGQIDIAADTLDELSIAVRKFLEFLPSNSWSTRVCETEHPPLDRDERLRHVVPGNLRSPYDVRRLLDLLIDDADFLELRPGVGAGVVTGLAAINGHSVGVVASQPLRTAGALTPQGCDKIVRLLCTCDAFGVPVVILQDTPGFMVGTNVEHERMLFKAMMLHQAVALASVPILTVIIRKSYGLATACLGGAGMGTDSIFAWPGAQIGFMDPQVAARVLNRRELDAMDPGERDRATREHAEALSQDNSIYAAAALMRVDEIIDPADTRAILGGRLHDLSNGRSTGRRSVLATWPNSW